PTGVRRPARARALVPVADTHGRLERPGRRRARDPRHLRDAPGPRLEPALPTHHHAVPRRVERLHVERRRGAHAEPAALADREAMDARVAPQHAAGLVDDLPRPRRALRAEPLDGRARVAVGHEAQLLALGLVRRREPERPRTRAHLVLRELAEREARAFTLRRGEAEQEVGLVLPRIPRGPERRLPRCGVTTDARVVPGRD